MAVYSSHFFTSSHISSVQYLDIHRIPPVFLKSTEGLLQRLKTP